jgi:oligoribonuclease
MMKYISIDIETTGLNSERHQILEIGAIIDNFENPLPLEQLPKFHCYLHHEEVIGEPYALALNSEILRKISDHDNEKYMFCEVGEVASKFREFLDYNGLDKITAAGKNYATFDKSFLDKLPNWKELIKVRRRVIDLGSIFFNPKIHNEILPSLSECLKMAGMIPEVAHTSLEDALVVVQLLRYRFGPILNGSIEEESKQTRIK